MYKNVKQLYKDLSLIKKNINNVFRKEKKFRFVICIIIIIENYNGGVYGQNRFTQKS